MTLSGIVRWQSDPSCPFPVNPGGPLISLDHFSLQCEISLVWLPKPSSPNAAVLLQVDTGNHDLDLVLGESVAFWLLWQVDDCPQEPFHQCNSRMKVRRNRKGLRTDQGLPSCLLPALRARKLQVMSPGAGTRNFQPCASGDRDKPKMPWKVSCTTGGE